MTSMVHWSQLGLVGHRVWWMTTARHTKNACVRHTNKRAHPCKTNIKLTNYSKESLQLTNLSLRLPLTCWDNIIRLSAHLRSACWGLRGPWCFEDVRLSKSLSSHTIDLVLSHTYLRIILEMDVSSNISPLWSKVQLNVSPGHKCNF